MGYFRRRFTRKSVTRRWRAADERLSHRATGSDALPASSRASLAKDELTHIVGKAT
jgi:hypothetical protein